jgi:hypothetical protein
MRLSIVLCGKIKMFTIVARCSEIYIRLFLFVIFYLFPLVVFASPGDAEDFKNKSMADIQNLLGDPDAKKSMGEGRESWSYGSSIVLFRDGTVTAWSDAGELREQKNLSQIQKQEVAISPWLNPWTPEPEVTAEEVVDDLLRR